MWQGLASRILPVAALVVIWELTGRAGALNPLLMPEPSQLVKTFAEMLQSGQLLEDTRASLVRVGVGFALAVVVGTPLGLALGLSRRFNAVFEPLVGFLRPIPPIAWIPLAILWFGIGNGPAYFLTMTAALFPIVLNVHLGVRSLSPQHLDVARCFEARFPLVLRRIVWPASLPYTFSGYRIGIGVAWMTVVGAEMIAAQTGLGHLIHASQDLLQTDKVIVGMLTIGVIGLAIDALLRRVERRIVPWKQVAA